MRAMRTVFIAALLLSAPPAAAIPLDVFDTTPRTVLVEFETSASPGVVGQTYSSQFQASYSASGNVGTLVIAAAVYESAMQALGSVGFTFQPLIAGSVSDFSLNIDLTTLEATTNPPLTALFDQLRGPADG